MWFTLAAPAAAQGLLPASFDTWNSEGVETAWPATLDQFAGNRAAALREYAAVSAERRAYRRGGESLVVVVYRMADASGAYGAATFLRSDEMRNADLGEHSAISRERAVALVGNLVLTVERPSGDLLRETAALRGLVAAIYPQAQGGSLPAVSGFLPDKGLIPGSQRYVQGPVALNAVLPLGQGDWIGFSDGADVALAKYDVGSAQVTLLLVSYPTPQVAARRLQGLGRWLAINPAGAVPAGQQVVFAKRSASLVALVLGTGSQTAAEALLAPIRYDAEITWNEPGFSATEPGIGEIVVGTIYGTGILLLLALAAGIGFGGVRVVMKYLLPGKLFDRAPSVEIIQLGLSSKPIEAKDFYVWTR